MLSCTADWQLPHLCFKQSILGTKHRSGLTRGEVNTGRRLQPEQSLAVAASICLLGVVYSSYVGGGPSKLFHALWRACLAGVLQCCDNTECVRTHEVHPVCAYPSGGVCVGTWCSMSAGQPGRECMCCRHIVACKYLGCM